MRRETHDCDKCNRKDIGEDIIRLYVKTGPRTCAEDTEGRCEELHFCTKCAARLLQTMFVNQKSDGTNKDLYEQNKEWIKNNTKVKLGY